MSSTWIHARSTSMIRIRNVSPDLHRRLKAKAALAGLSLSDYLLRAIREVVERPTLEEWLKRIEVRTPVRNVDVVQYIRDLRDR